jgi:monoamine oxidase
MKVLVLGAGISGIAAARELAALGFSVHVIEARERIGTWVLRIITKNIRGSNSHNHI